MFINDPFTTDGPARGKRELWRETQIGNRVSIGSNATIMPVNICDDVVNWRRSSCNSFYYQTRHLRRQSCQTTQT